MCVELKSPSKNGFSIEFVAMLVEIVSQASIANEKTSDGKEYSQGINTSGAVNATEEKIRHSVAYM